MSDPRLVPAPSRLRRGVLGGILAAALLGAMAIQVVPANAVGTCSSPPSVFPEDQLHKGMVATGQTVIDGTTPTSFDVKILGILQDGIAPGLDLIVARITGPQDFLDATGGIFAGMSGSPISIDNQLVGAASYGFFGDQTIFGITPAQPMIDLFGYPEGSGTAQTQVRSYARTIRLSSSEHEAVAREAGVSSSDFSSSAHLIRTPLGVSGLSAQRVGKVQKAFHRLGIPVVAYSSGSVAKPRHAHLPPLSPGKGFSALLSYGDLSTYGIGTTTATCGNLAVAFGHPFDFTGGAHLAMNGAETLVIDKAGEYGSYEIATPTQAHGTIDQDRLAGVRGIEGTLPSVARNLFNVTNPDIGKSRIGETDDVDQTYMPFVTAFGLLAEEDVTFDRVGDGSVKLAWVIRGVGPDGLSFHLSRNNIYYSPYDATFSSIIEVLQEIIQLQQSSFGKPNFTSMRFTSTVTQQELTTQIQKVEVGSSLEPLGKHRALKVEAGRPIHIRVTLLDHGSTTPRVVDMSLKAPHKTGQGELEIRPGQGSGGYFFGFAGGVKASGKATSFEQLVRQLARAEHNYDLVAELSGGSSPKPVPGGGGGTRSSFDVKTVSPQQQVVEGRKLVRVEIVPN